MLLITIMLEVSATDGIVLVMALNKLTHEVLATHDASLSVLIYPFLNYCGAYCLAIVVFFKSKNGTFLLCQAFTLHWTTVPFPNWLLVAST